MRLRVLLIIVTVLMVAFMPGCTRENAGSEDEDAINEIIASSPYFSIEDAYFEGRFVTDSTFDLKGDTILLGWWRSPVSVSRNVWVNVIRDTARVEVNTHIYGKFRLVYLIRNGSSIDTLNVEKSFHDVVKRYALFTREGSIDDPHRGWVLKAVSLGYCETKDLPVEPFFKIDSVRITHNCGDTTLYVRTFSDLLALIPVDSLPYARNTGTLTFETWTSPTFPRVFAFFYGGGMWLQPFRVRMIYEDFRFVKTIDVPSLPLPKHLRFGISVISRGSFSPDPNEPYFSRGVIIPVKCYNTQD